MSINRACIWCDCMMFCLEILLFVMLFVWVGWCTFADSFQGPESMYQYMNTLSKEDYFMLRGIGQGDRPGAPDEFILPPACGEEAFLNGCRQELKAWDWKE